MLSWHGGHTCCRNEFQFPTRMNYLYSPNNLTNNRAGPLLMLPEYIATMQVDVDCQSLDGSTSVRIILRA